jgi:hypothetical protein
MWIIGGCLLAASLFRFHRSEVAMVGLGIGLVTETWLANILARIIPVAIAFWLAAVLTLLGGLIAVILMKRKSIKINFFFFAQPMADSFFADDSLYLDRARTGALR